ncbi:putative protein SPATA31J1 [Saimiri boliviensis]|uniref:putative protein SPATA31J1 n=1 Tax=Saimiri boliviensis TaxID=27679 RepID=UPI003D779875
MPRAQLPEGSSAVDIDIVFPPESIRLSSSPMLWMMHFILIVACSLVILAFLCSYIFRKPSSAPPRKRNGRKGQAEVRSWLRIRNKKITLKACRSLLKNLENARDHTLLLEKRLRKLPGDGSFHCLLNRDRLTESFKRGPGSVHRPHGRCGKASPTSLSPQAPLAPLASMPSPDLKTSIGSFESLSTLSTSQPPEPLRPLKHPSHPPHAGTLLPNPTTSVESLGLDVPKLLDTQGTKIPDTTLNTAHQLGLSPGQPGGTFPSWCGHPADTGSSCSHGLGEEPVETLAASKPRAGPSWCT